MAIRFCEKCGHQVNSDALFCSNCGAKLPHSNDRVDEGALWESFVSNSSPVESAANSSPSPIIKRSDMFFAHERELVCYNCKNTIPSDSRFCPVCQIELFQTCPKCGNIFSTQYCNCNRCGTNIELYLKQEEERKRLVPIIKVFRIEKRGTTYFKGVTLYWQTINAQNYNLSVSNPKKEDGRWYDLRNVGSLFHEKNGNERNGVKGLSATELQSFVPIFNGKDNSLYFRFTAYGNDTVSCTRTIRLRLRADYLSPMQFISIDEVEDS